MRTVGDKAVVDPGIMFGLDAALWRSSIGVPGREALPSDMEGTDHMDADAECFHVIPADVPSGWSATRKSLEALVRARAHERPPA